VLVDGTAAVVGKTLITVQDAYFYRALQRFRDGQPDMFARETGEPLRKTVQKMALEEMVFAEMKSFKLEGTPRAEAHEIIKHRRGKGTDGPWTQLLHRFAKSENGAVEQLSRSLSVEHFLEKKVETLTPIITEAEAESYYRQNQARFPNEPFDRLKANITRFLRKQRMEKALEDWVRFLREKYGLTKFL
jgi:hypothetical protein